MPSVVLTPPAPSPMPAPSSRTQLAHPHPKVQGGGGGRGRGGRGRGDRPDRHPRPHEGYPHYVHPSAPQARMTCARRTPPPGATGAHLSAQQHSTHTSTHAQQTGRQRSSRTPTASHTHDSITSSTNTRRRDHHGRQATTRQRAHARTPLPHQHATTQTRKHATL